MYGKNCFKAKESTWNSEGGQGKVKSDVSKGVAPSGNRQSAGETKYSRMNTGKVETATKVENMQELPNVHSGGGKGSVAGYA